MAKKQKCISIQVSTPSVRYKPGGSPTSFEVSVTNDSDEFAAFQLEVIAAGANSSQAFYWYNLSPEVSAKKPPGDRTRFVVAITDTPVPGFIGTINLTVRVFSLELQEEERQLVRLIVEQGVGSIPMQVTLPVRAFQNNPNDLLEIPVQIFNPSQLLVHTEIRFGGINSTWLVEGVERRLPIDPGSKAETTFWCQLPDITDTLSQVYPFTIEVTQPNGPATVAEGTIEVLPKGYMVFQCLPAKQSIPQQRNWMPKWLKDRVKKLLPQWNLEALAESPPSGLPAPALSLEGATGLLEAEIPDLETLSQRPKPKPNTAVYELQFENFSNLLQEVSAEVESEDRKKLKWEISPEQVVVKPGQTLPLQLIVTKKRPWIGRDQEFILQASAVVADQQIDVRNDTQLLKLKVLVVLRPWMQVTLGAASLALAWALSWLNPYNPWYGHQASVSSVEINGSSNEVISASDDHTMIFWRVWGFTNPLVNQQIGPAGDAKKAIRVVRYKPLNNDLLAAGLENGEIQLWSGLEESEVPITSFYYQKDDRVFDLVFTRDSLQLFSGHGSGFVNLWDTHRDIAARNFKAHKPKLQRRFDFAVYNMALVGENYDRLAVAGRFNRLEVWNWLQDQVIPIPYRTGSKDNYIMGIDAPEYQPHLLATGDNQGVITLWNLKPCLEGSGECTILDEWSTGHGGKAVRTVSMTSDGCYLATGGDDGRVMLWPLSPEGKRAPAFLSGQEADTAYSGQKVNSVHIRILDANILVASGSQDTQVRVQPMPRLPEAGCDRVYSDPNSIPAE